MLALGRVNEAVAASAEAMDILGMHNTMLHGHSAIRRAYASSLLAEGRRDRAAEVIAAARSSVRDVLSIADNARILSFDTAREPA
jgi:hypothetical protein